MNKHTKSIKFNNQLQRKALYEVSIQQWAMTLLKVIKKLNTVLCCHLSGWHARI